jgi:hypothetical protein
MNGRKPMSNPDRPGAAKAPSTAAEAKQAAAGAADKAKNVAEDKLQDVTKAAAEQADAAKSSMADEMSGVASALRTAANELRDGSPQERTFGQIADGLADASDALRDKDLGTLVNDATDFARANPMVFLGSVALVGFAATRFAKASGDTGTPVSRMPAQVRNTGPVSTRRGVS